MESSYLIGQLAQGAEVKTDTVRYYERKGLLPKPTRTAAGYRVYNEGALRRLRFIRKAQALGFSLDEIQRILNLSGQGEETCRCVINIAEATLTETKEKIRELEAFRDALRSNLKLWRRATARKRDLGAEFCALIEGE